LCKNHTVEAAGDHHAVSFDLSLDLGAFPENHGLFGNDIALDVAVDAERSSDRQGALERHALIDKSSPLFAVAIFPGAGPLPSHASPKNRLLPLYRPAG